MPFDRYEGMPAINQNDQQQQMVPLIERLHKDDNRPRRDQQSMTELCHELTHSRRVHLIGSAGLGIGAGLLGASLEGPTWGDFGRICRELPQRWQPVRGLAAADYAMGAHEARNFESAVELWRKGLTAWWMSPGTPVAEERALMRRMACRGAVRGVVTAAGAFAADYAVSELANHALGHDSQIAQTLRPSVASVGLSTAGIMFGGYDWRVKAALGIGGWALGKVMNYYVDSQEAQSAERLQLNARS